MPLTDEVGNVGIVRTGSAVYQPGTCEPERDADGNVVVESATIEGDIDVQNGLRVEFVRWPSSQDLTGYSRNQIVWQPAKADIDGVMLELNGRYLRPTSMVRDDPVLGSAFPILLFEWDDTGSEISGKVTRRLLEANSMPLAPFLDGEPFLGDDGQIIAPNVVGEISSSGQFTGLSLEEAEQLSLLLNTGAFPIAFEIVEVQEVEG